MDISPEPPKGKTINLDDYKRETPVRTVKITLQCPNCLKGDLQYTGMQQPGQPPLFQHRCKCGYEIAIAGKHYPLIDFREDDDDNANTVDSDDGSLARIGQPQIGTEGGGLGPVGGNGTGQGGAADGGDGGAEPKTGDDAHQRPLPTEHEGAD